MVRQNGRGLTAGIGLFIIFFTFILSGCGGKKVTDEPPVAVIELPEASGIAPFKVFLRGSASYSPKSSISRYSWDFPDGTLKTGDSVSHTFTEKGVYQVDLTVEDTEGLVGVSSITINVVGTNDRFSIQGSISSLPFTDTDSDVNDPNAYYASNDGDGADQVQAISNPTELSGFSSRSGTTWSGDRFANRGDQQDHFSVRLEAKDYVSLFLADYVNSDLDLYIYKADSLDMVAYSDGVGEFESVQIVEDGEYIVVVQAEKGATNYVLNIGRNALVSGVFAMGKTTNFALNEVVVQMEELDVTEAAQTYADEAQIRMSHKHKHRAMLGRINPLNPQTHSRLWGKMRENGFQGRLMATNWVAAEKFKTIRAIKQLNQQKGIRFAEPNYKVRGLLTPNDPYFVYQWHLEKLNMKSAWDITTGDTDVVIAVVDTGVYLDHPDLEGQLISGYDFVSDPDSSNDGDGLDSDPTDPGDGGSFFFSSWHGTHVAGIAVAAINNREGVVGIAPKAKVMPIRALGADGGLMYDILQAVRYSAGLENDSNTLPERPADIINLSLGGEGYSAAPQEIFREVREKGIVVVAASGNENTGIAMYPASYEGVISVGSATYDAKRAPYSNTGATLDVMAYGGNMTEDLNNDDQPDGILSTLVDESSSAITAGYEMYDGTSMACPQVSAVIALMKSVYPELKPELVDSLLYSGAITHDLGDAGRDNDFGYGLIDGLKAVEAAQALSQGATTTALVAGANVLVFDASLTEKTLQVKSIGNGSLSVIDFSASEDWLKISKLNVDSSGLGSYRVSVLTEGFDNGNYRAYVSFSTDLNTTVKVEVILRIGAASEVGDAGFIYVLLVNADTAQLAGSNELASDSGVYNFEFEDVPVGEYYITAGSDSDNNGVVCEYAETCGMYPTIDSFEIFKLVGDKVNLNFDVGLYQDSDLGLFSAQRRKLKK